MTAPELLLYWLFYINKHSQNVADKKPVNPTFYSSVLAAFYFMTELIWVVVNVFVAEPLQQEVNETAFPGFSAYQVFAS